ncbi:seryl-tRNA synthetase [Tanacetum coccineum]
MLDIIFFRKEKGYDPKIIRESQRRRFEPVEIVNEIIHLDNEWRQGDFELQHLSKSPINHNMRKKLVMNGKNDFESES